MRETGANVIETMDGIRAAISELNEQRLPQQRLQLEQVYDETVYIDSSINLVQQNILIGGLLAAFILLISSAQAVPHLLSLWQYQCP